MALRFIANGDVLDETILPREIQMMLIVCLKTIAGLDASVIDRPQDTKFLTDEFGNMIEMRVTSIPSTHGEMVAIKMKAC